MKKKILSSFIVIILICLFSGGGIYGLYKLGAFPKTGPIVYSSTNIDNRVYLKNSGLVGDETISVLNKEHNLVKVRVFSNMITGFDTSTIGKKQLEINYNGTVQYCNYYVVSSSDDTFLNCISKVYNLHQTYYLNEDINLTNVKIEVNEVVDGYLTTELIPVTSEMVKGFDSSCCGTKTLTIKYKNYKYQVKYFVIEKSEEKITAESFIDDIYYENLTAEETEHFKIEIAAGTIVKADYKTLIEEIYAAMLEVTGLQPNKKITIKVNNTYFPSCGSATIYINTYELFLGNTSAFSHELAHALDDIQAAPIYNNNGVVKEGFASFVEYLTAKKLYETNSVAYAYSGNYSGILNDINFLKGRMYFYDFEKDLLDLKRDELVPNSQYEVGSRFFAYLHSRYKDFCGWLKNENLYAEDLSVWADNIKKYYKNENIFDEFYEYEQAFGVDFKYNVTPLENTGFLNYYNNDSDYSRISTYNFYYQLDKPEASWGSIYFNYKNLYFNLESLKKQLTINGYNFTRFSVEVRKPLTMELYSKNNNLIKTVTTVNDNEIVDLTEVSYIKFVGFGVADLEFLHS